MMMLRAKKQYKWIIMGAIILYLFTFGRVRYEEITGLSQTESYTDQQPLPAFVIIVCDESEGNMLPFDSRQFQQVEILFKSAVTLTRQPFLRFLVMTETKEVFEHIQAISSLWPDEYKNRLVLEHREFTYTPEQKTLRDLTRPCATQRLFLPETLSEIDSAVYVDTDTLFLWPPEELLKKVYQFDDKQAIALAQTSGGYEDKKVPYPGPRGVNTGVIIWNMTRLRALPGGGWTGTTLDAYNRYKDYWENTFTNDVFNIVLAENIEILYDLECVWNYNPGVCWKGSNTCLLSEDIGVHLLHGASKAFIVQRNSKFKAVFQAWQEYEFGTPISSLIAPIQEKIENDDSPPTRCHLISNFKFIFTEGLRRMH